MGEAWRRYPVPHIADGTELHLESLYELRNNRMRFVLRCALERPEQVGTLREILDHVESILRLRRPRDETLIADLENAVEWA